MQLKEKTMPKKKRYLNNLKKYRRDCGLTQIQFAKECKFKTGQARVALYESGLRDPSLSDIRLMIEVFKRHGMKHASINELFPTEKEIRG